MNTSYDIFRDDVPTTRYTDWETHLELTTARLYKYCLRKRVKKLTMDAITQCSLKLDSGLWFPASQSAKTR